MNIIRMLGVFTTLLILSVLPALSKSKNELVIGIGLAEGTFSNISGVHAPVTGSTGTNVKTITLTDNKLQSRPSISIDYMRNVTNNFWLNTGLQYISVNSHTPSILIGSGFTQTPFPDINFFGVLVDVGPSYRFETNSDFTPFVGLNAQYFYGNQDNTFFGQTNETYGVGGDHSFARCLGYGPNVGVFSNSGILNGFGVTIESVNVSCNLGHQRSLEAGYRGDFSILKYQLDYRISF